MTFRESGVPLSILGGSSPPTPPRERRQAIPARDKPYSMQVPIDQILPWDGNPLARTTDKALAALEAAVRESGSIAEIAAVNNGDDTVTVGDGHRRRQVGVNLDFKKLQVRVFPGSEYTPERLFKIMNEGSRAQKATDWLEAHLLSGILPSNGALAYNIRYCIRLCGSKDEARHIMLDGSRAISPNIAKMVQLGTALLTGQNFAGHGKTIEITDQHRAVFAWVIKHGESRLRQLLTTVLITPPKKRKMFQAAVRNDSDLFDKV